jgi:hypothetical protein
VLLYSSFFTLTQSFLRVAGILADELLWDSGIIMPFAPPPPPSSSLTLKTVVAVAASLVIKVDGRFPKQAHLIINHIAFILGLDEDRKVISWVSHSAVCALLLSVAFPDLRSNSLSFSNQVAHHWGNPNPKMLLLGSCLESGHGQD